MNNNNLTNLATVAVRVGHQVFYIPQEKAQQLIQTLQNWQQPLNVPEKSTIANQYPGLTLIQG